MTCPHVVKGATNINIRLGDRQYQGTVLAMDTTNDLAVLKIPADNLVPLPLGSAQAVQLAESVRIAGYPLTDVLGRSIKITQGSIAGIIERTEGRLFQVDGSVNPGNSGGPVINDRGHVIGVTGIGFRVSTSPTWASSSPLTESNTCSTGSKCVTNRLRAARLLRP